jgi:CheY-like chemotaxis protein
MGLRVLAIDNEPRVLDGMRTLLTKWGCRVAIALDLREARAALATLDGLPDAIVADYHLDEGDGLSAIAALRHQLGERTPAILATADRSVEVREAAARADVALLNKPLKPAPLRAQLRRCQALREAAE